MFQIRSLPAEPSRPWKPWLTQNFRLGYDSAKIYMKLAQHEENEKGSTLPFSSMREFREKELGYKPSVRPTPWHEKNENGSGTTENFQWYWKFQKPQCVCVR